MILVLDLDETLVHSHHSKPRGTDTFPIYDYHVEKRPYLDHFLHGILNDDDYQVGIWSAGAYDYVWDIIETIVPDLSLLEFILTRDDCSIMDDDYVKPLSTVAYMYEDLGYPMSVHDIALIDNKPGVTADNLRHILVNDYEGGQDDYTLPALWHYLSNNRGMSSEWLAANWK